MRRFLRHSSPPAPPLRRTLTLALTGLLASGALLALAPPLAAQQEAATERDEPPAQEETWDYWAPQREMVRRGQQAILTCNGLFTSNRSLEQVYERELAFFREPIGTPAGGDYEIDRERRAVAIGDPDTGPVMRAAFRDGIGCVILAPDQDFGDIDGLPVLDMPPPPRAMRPRSRGPMATSCGRPSSPRRSTPPRSRRRPTGRSTASRSTSTRSRS